MTRAVVNSLTLKSKHRGYADAQRPHNGTAPCSEPFCAVEPEEEPQSQSDATMVFRSHIRLSPRPPD